MSAKCAEMPPDGKQIDCYIERFLVSDDIQVLAALGVQADDLSVYPVIMRGDMLLLIIERPELKHVWRRESNQRPSLAQMAMNAAGAAARVVKAAVSNQQVFALPEVQEIRKQVCAGCPKWDPARDTCTMCGCALKMKRKLATEACPDGRWGAAVQAALHPTEPSQP